MSKPTRETVERWISVAQSGLIGREYRDVFLKLPEILRAYLAQEKELVDERLRRKLEYWEAREVIDKLEAENQELERKCKLLCCRVGVLEMENHGKRKEG